MCFFFRIFGALVSHFGLPFPFTFFYHVVYFHCLWDIGILLRKSEEAIDWLIDWLGIRRIDRLIDWLIDRLGIQPMDWLIDWLIDRLGIRRMDWLIDWWNDISSIQRIDWLIDWLITTFHLQMNRWTSVCKWIWKIIAWFFSWKKY